MGPKQRLLGRAVREPLAVAQRQLAAQDSLVEQQDNRTAAAVDEDGRHKAVHAHVAALSAELHSSYRRDAWRHSLVAAAGEEVMVPHGNVAEEVEQDHLMEEAAARWEVAADCWAKAEEAEYR
jgi:nicotinamide mononucleotide adenylyltransferase